MRKKRAAQWGKRIAAVLLLLVILGLAALPAVFMNSVYGYFPGLFVLVLLILSLASLWVFRRRLSFSSELQDLYCERGHNVDVGLKLTNRSAISCPRAKAAVYISDVFGGTDALRVINFTLAAKETVDFSFGMDMAHIGVYSVGINSLTIYDLFGVFCRRIPVSGRCTAVVTPAIRPVRELSLEDEAMAEANTETRTTVVGGMDYTGVREYVPGDPMKQIHWKLSAHSRDYLTKLQESHRQQEYAVVLDFAAQKQEDQETLMDIHDCLIETALSLMYALMERDISCTLLYTNRQKTVVRTAQVGRDNLQELIRSFSVITPQPEEDYPDAAQILRLERQAQNRSTNVIVVSARATDALVQELAADKRQKRCPELYMVVPAQFSSRQREAAAAPLHPLEEEEIPYYLVSTNRIPNP